MTTVVRAGRECASTSVGTNPHKLQWLGSLHVLQPCRRVMQTRQASASCTLHQSKKDQAYQLLSWLLPVWREPLQHTSYGSDATRPHNGETEARAVHTLIYQLQVTPYMHHLAGSL